MLLSVIGKVMFVRRTGDISADGLRIEIEGIGDGTEVLLTRAGTTEHYYSTLKAGAVTVCRDFADGVYSVSVRDADGDALTARFEVRDGIIRKKYRGLDTELGEMWEAIAHIASRVNAEDEKIETVIDGYETE